MFILIRKKSSSSIKIAPGRSNRARLLIVRFESNVNAWRKARRCQPGPCDQGGEDQSLAERFVQVHYKLSWVFGLAGIGTWRGRGDLFAIAAPYFIATWFEIRHWRAPIAHNKDSPTLLTHYWYSSCWRSESIFLILLIPDAKTIRLLPFFQLSTFIFFLYASNFYDLEMTLLHLQHEIQSTLISKVVQLKNVL